MTAHSQKHSVHLDADAVVAASDLAGRSGATGFEIGYLRDDVPADQAGWYARANYRGATIFVDERKGPDEAADALARRILHGGRCTHCDRTVTLATYAQNPGCRWRRFGASWTRGCVETHR